MSTDIFKRIEDYLKEEEDLEDDEFEEEEEEEEEDDMDEEVEDALDSFLSLDESRKSQFVAKLIGLGVLERGKDGKLIKKKDISKEKVIKKLNRRGKVKKAKKKAKSLLGMD